MYIKRKLSESLESYSSLRFGCTLKSKKRFFHQATVGIGGNLGDVKRRFEHLFFALKREKRVELIKTSLILKNPPFGYLAQDDFFNSIMIIDTSMQAKEFLRFLQRVEKKFGRKRSFANAPRTLDLDIIFFDKQVLNTPTLTLPHPEWYKRESVLIPLGGLKR